MKWFKHLSNSRNNLKLMEIVKDFGLEGYAIYWIALEMVAEQGEKYRLNGTKSWKKALMSTCEVEIKKLDEILKRFGELNLICRKSLEKGDLYIPKMREYADEYNTRVSRQCRDTLLIDKNRIDKNRIDKVLQAFLNKKHYPQEASDLTYYYRRYTNTIKRGLVLAKGNAEQFIEAMNWFGDICDKKGLSWSLETIERWLPEYLSKGKAMDYEKALVSFGLKKG